MIIEKAVNLIRKSSHSLRMDDLRDGEVAELMTIEGVIMRYLISQLKK